MDWLSDKHVESLRAHAASIGSHRQYLAPNLTTRPGPGGRQAAVVYCSKLLPDSRGNSMGNKIVTEADRKRTPAAKLAEGYGFRKEGTGQRISRERGSATRSKKNPGKRAHQGR